MKRLGFLVLGLCLLAGPVLADDDDDEKFVPIPAPQDSQMSMAFQEIADAFEPFGPLHIYKTSEQPKHVVLFISGDGGWDVGVQNMVRSLQQPDTMLVGIDITSYVKKINDSKSKCTYGAAQFEALSQYLQKKYKFSHYIQPILVGFSSGATMVYAILAQSPANTFAGGISMGFCPDLKTVHPFCKGNGGLTYKVNKDLGFVYQITSKLPATWIVLQGNQDEVCSTPDTRKFVGKVEKGEIFELPKVGHGFSVERNWVPEFRAAFQQIIRENVTQGQQPDEDSDVHDLPLIELPAEKKSETMAIIISGDGGWANIDKEIGDTLRDDGVPVVGLNSLQYFWEKKTPDIAGKDLARIMEHYTDGWGAKKFILVGYSRGADTLPFMVSRLPDDLKKKVQSVSLLGLEDDVDFEFRVADWVSDSDGHYKTLPEIKKIENMSVMCLYGDEEDDSACTKLDAKKITVVKKSGGHHFGGDYEGLAQLILQQGKKP